MKTCVVLIRASDAKSANMLMSLQLASVWRRVLAATANLIPCKLLREQKLKLHNKRPLITAVERKEATSDLVSGGGGGGGATPGTK